MKENVKRAMEELAGLGWVHPHLLADDSIETNPAIPEQAAQIAQIMPRHGLRELKPNVWGE